MDGMPDPTAELPRSLFAPETPVAGPGPDGALFSPPLAWQRRAAGTTGRTLLVLLVIGLGLLHGTRTALGSARPLEADPLPDVAAPPPVLETDWHGVTFYRPLGSTARPPEADLVPRVWIPRPRVGPRMARACTRVRSAGC